MEEYSRDAICQHVARQMQSTEAAMRSAAAARRGSTTPIVIAETTPICLHVVASSTPSVLPR